MPARRMTEKQRIEKWNRFVKMVLEGTLINDKEPPEVQTKRKQELEANPEDWFNYYFPKFSYAPPAQFQKDATQRVLSNPEWCEVRMWSRELAKSTRTMMEVMYLTFVGHTHNKNEEQNNKKKCVLMVSNSLDNASRLLMPYRANLTFNKRIIQDYGIQFGEGTWTGSEFITAGGTSYRAVGIGQSPRGTRNEEARPDIIVFDDTDTDADCLNPDTVARKWRWIEEAAISTRSVSEPTTIIFCGNRIAADSCIQRATEIADHVHEVNIRDSDGKSTWPQKNKEHHINRVLRQKSYAAQQKEYFNNPIVEGAVFKELAYKPARQLDDYSIFVCYTDPSYKTNADYKATVLVGKWKHEYHILKCYLEQATTARMIDWHYRIMDYIGNRSCYFYMEQVFMQDVIVKELSETGKRLGRSIPIRGDTRKKPDKFMRIESLLEPMVRNGELFLNKDQQHDNGMRRLAEQFRAISPAGRTHDDGPDAVEGAVWIINQKTTVTRTSGIAMSERTPHNKRY